MYTIFKESSFWDLFRDEKVVFMLVCLLFLFLVFVIMGIIEDANSKRYEKEQKFRDFMNYVFKKYKIRENIKELYTEYYLFNKKNKDRQIKQLNDKIEAECSFEEFF